jgi:hypothetical protein
MGFARTVVETDLVAARIDAAAKKYPRIGELYESLKWLLARDPDAGVLIPGSNPPRRIAKTFTWRPGGTPSIAVIFQADDVRVVIESSRVYEETLAKRVPR